MGCLGGQAGVIGLHPALLFARGVDCRGIIDSSLGQNQSHRDKRKIYYFFMCRFGCIKIRGLVYI